MRAHLTAIALALAACGGSSDPSPDAGSLCRSQEACSDGVFCNGQERCAPGATGANEAGCLPGIPPCFATQTCDEMSDACATNCDRNPDADGDGRAAASCGGDDCDDTDASRYPGNVEVCDLARHDEDCDPSTVGALDADGDGQIAIECCNERPDGTELCGTDCDDSAYGRQPGFPELCDGVDNDCDGTVDEDPREAPWYADADGDGFGDASDSIVSCAPVDGRVLADNDCDDEDPAIRPGAIERCAGTDDDCDGEVDEGACGTDALLSVGAAFTLNGVEPDADVCTWAGVDSVRFEFDRGDGSLAFETEVSCDAGGFDTRPTTPLGRGTFTLRVTGLDAEAEPVGETELLVTALPPLVHLGLPPVDLRVGATVCTQDVQCDDGNFCNGAERCALGVGRCSAAIAPREDGELCDADGDPATTDICVAGGCTMARCGDGFLTRETEECDDGNLTPLDGCDDACRADDQCLAWFSSDGVGESQFRSIRVTRAGLIEGSAGAGIRGVPGVAMDATLGENERNALASCGPQLVAAHHDDDALHVLAHRNETDLSASVFRVPLTNPLAVACPPEGAFAYVLTSDSSGVAIAHLHSFAVPLTPASTPVASITLDFGVESDEPELEQAWLRRWPGQDSLLVVADWRSSGPENMARVAFDATGGLTVAEAPTRIDDLIEQPGTFAITPNGSRFVKAKGTAAAVRLWATSGTLATTTTDSLSRGNFLDGTRFVHFAPDEQFVTENRVGRLGTTEFEQVASFSAGAGATYLYEGALFVSWGANIRTYESPTMTSGTLTALDTTGVGVPVTTAEPVVYLCAP